MADLEVRAAAGAADWLDCQRIRTRVFIEEQACPEDEEWDGLDATCEHVIGAVGGTAVATARWRWVGPDCVKLERFAVLEEHRGHGYGRTLVEHAIEAATAAGAQRLELHAQAHLVGFYRSLGFAIDGAEFVEAGIPHRRMVRDVRVP